MNAPLAIPNADLMEMLAELEHEQWMHWSQTVVAEVTDATRAKWQPSWTDYAELPDDLKEADRIWARKVVTVLRQRQLIP